MAPERPAAEANLDSDQKPKADLVGERGENETSGERTACETQTTVMQTLSTHCCAGNESSTNATPKKDGGCVMHLVAHDLNSKSDSQTIGKVSTTASASIEQSRERFAQICALSKQELRIFLLVGLGMRPANIARYGGKQRSPRTIDTYLRRIRTKLDMRGASLLKLAMFAADFQKSGLKLEPEAHRVKRPNFRFK